MRRLFPAVLAVLFTLPLAANNIRFEPPNPTSATPVVAHVLVRNCGGATLNGVERHGNIISITVNYPGACIPELGNFAEDIRADLGVLPAGVYDVVASPGMLLLGIAEATLPVRDAAPPFGVKPNVSDIYGGFVRLNGEGIAQCGTTICTPVVKFGDVAATHVIADSTSEIVVEAPPHDPGIVDITIEKGGTTLRSTAAFHYYGATPNAAFFERVLVPVFFSGPGAFGSQWKTEAALYNGDDYPIDEAGQPFFTFQCPFDPCDGRPQPRATTFASGESVPTGVVSFLPRYAMPNVHFSVLVRDLSRDATDFGTSVPVVRESEMFTRAFSLVNVPSDARYRLGLRLYAYDTIPTTFLVTMTPIGGGNVANFNVPLLPAREHAFAFIGDLLAEHPEVAGQGPMTITITPFEPASRAWGYVSITNNNTQHVTVITPE
jgi:hypothetical protein